MKLSPATIYIFGLAVFVIFFSFGLFWHYMPNMAEANLWEENYKSLEIAANQQKAAEKRVQDAKDLVNAKAATWNAVVAKRTPPPALARGGINLSVNTWQLSVDTQRYRNNVQRAVNAQLRRGGVTVVNGPLVPGPDVNAPANSLLATYFNFPAYPFPVVIYDLGPVTVQGRYEQIMANVRAYRTMPNYLAVADGLRIDGTSPNLTGTYNLSIVGFIRAKQVFPAAQIAEGAPAPSGSAPAPGLPTPGGQAPAPGPGKLGRMG